ncbi:NAD-dependent epimerase/dehydratase family protein [Acuticoccus mangrovi]|uniref:NAD(P)-dependent oxidoreductase n=1 Tax=Acuticoccus mangrovi TaxID=2796142 RepID=A0A934MIH2_9HYPH|nr:NAD(P)-dependent oxidoreductase [Acuticoccus mangrovi]MBJ3777910.1 NAD(P)-dependent oxidoreductase [Acuticoccus mangrovi]
MTKPTIVLTGAAGGVGGMLRPLLAARYRLILSDRTEPPADLTAEETWHTADLTDRAAVDELMRGADGLIHLGGQSVEADWQTVHDANIAGLWNIYDACRAEGVARIIFASSNHAVGFYPRTRRIGVDQAVRPDGLYGVSKAFGEALGSLFADKHGLRVMSIRIGNVAEKPADHRRLSIWLHPEDLAQLIDIGLTHPDIHHAIVYGASHNERAWWDNSAAFALGYAPKHHAEDHVDYAMAEQAKLPADPVGDLLQGGAFCADGFDGDLSRTLSARLPR